MGFYNSHICGHASRAILPYLPKMDSRTAPNDL